MGAVHRRFLTCTLMLLAALVLVRASPEADPPPRPAEVPTFTLDRGGIFRFNNGKTDVEASYDLQLDRGPGQLPHEIGPWKGIDFPLNIEAYAAWMPELLINRSYRAADGRSVALTVIGSNTSRKLHRPEICYAAADWSLAEQPVHTVRLASGEVGLSKMVARSLTSTEQRVILYWYLWRDGRRRIEDGAYVVQVAAPLNGRTLDQATGVSEQFVRQLLRQASAPRPFMLPGLPTR